MKLDFDMVLAVFLAVIAASLVEHLVIAPRMAHSPGKTTPASPPIARTAEDWIQQNYPGAVSV